jgi:hypothetical protein
MRQLPTNHDHDGGLVPIHEYQTGSTVAFARLGRCLLCFTEDEGGRGGTFNA